MSKNFEVENNSLSTSREVSKNENIFIIPTSDNLLLSRRDFTLKTLSTSK